MTLRIESKKGQDGNTVLALFILFVAGLVFAPSAAQAKQGDHSAGFGIGQTLLMGDFSDAANDGLGFKFMYGYEASEMFGLLANFQFSNHSNNDGSNTLAIKGLSPDLKVNLAYIDKLVLYTNVGFGVHFVDQKLGNTEGGVVTLGFNLGGGFLLELDDHFSFGTSLGFHNVFGKTDTATVNRDHPNGITMGGTFLGIFLNGFYRF